MESKKNKRDVTIRVGDEERTIYRHRSALQRLAAAIKRMSPEDWFINIFNYVSLTLMALICVVPFLYVISISVSSNNSLGQYGVLLIPKEFSTLAYSYLFSRKTTLLSAFGVSIIVTVSGVLLGLITTGGMAYPLSKKNLPARKVFLGYVLFSMLFGGGLIPTYLAVNNWLGLEDSLFALILPGAFGAWNMILMKNFFSSLPDSIEESALIDGANEIQIFFRIVLPLSKPIFATIALFMAVGYWNDWFASLLYIRSTNKYPVMRVLKDMLTTDKIPGVGNPPPSDALKMAVVVVCVAPIMLVYPFLQKYFAKGILMGSIKG